MYTTSIRAIEAFDERAHGCRSVHVLGEQLLVARHRRPHVPFLVRQIGSLRQRGVGQYREESGERHNPSGSRGDVHAFRGSKESSTRARRIRPVSS
jgi:hypothetical protein